MHMPRSYDEIVALSEEMARSLESDHDEPSVPPAESVLRAAALRRSLAESELGRAVVAARADGMTWDRIGDAVGTSGEAARQKYGRLTTDEPERRMPVAKAPGAGLIKGQPQTSSEGIRTKKRSATTTVTVARNANTGRYVAAAAASKNRIAGATRKSAKPPS